MTDKEKQQLLRLARAVESDEGQLILQAALQFMLEAAANNHPAELVKGMGILIHKLQSAPQELEAVIHKH